MVAQCYWAILDSDLRFLVVDPVFERELGNLQGVLGTSLLSWIHEEEVEAARRDMASVTLSGTVTRSVRRDS